MIAIDPPVRILIFALESKGPSTQDIKTITVDNRNDILMDDGHQILTV